MIAPVPEKPYVRAGVLKIRTVPLLVIFFQQKIIIDRTPDRISREIRAFLSVVYEYDRSYFRIIVRSVRGCPGMGRPGTELAQTFCVGNIVAIFGRPGFCCYIHRSPVRIHHKP